MADLEAGPGAGRRQRRRAQAGRADPGLDHAADGAHRRPAAARRAQRRQRLRRRGRQAAGLQSSRIAQDRLHRRDHHRPADHAVRQPEPDPGHPGARRQEPEHLLRRRRREPTTPSTTRRSRASRMFALNQGEVCTCPSRALVQDVDLRRLPGRRRSPAPRRSSRATRWTPTPMIGAQASNDQLEKILSYIDIGRQEGAKVLTGGERVDLGGDLAGGYYVQPTIFEGDNTMRIFQEEIFGPVRRRDRASTTTTTRSRSPTTPCTASAPASGPATATPPTGRAAASRPAGSGPTATTPTRRTRRSAATSSPASAGRTTR